MSGYKALEFMQLCACKYMLECSVMTCDELVLADLGKFGYIYSKYSRDFRRLIMWYCKMKQMNGESLSFKLLSNEWNKLNNKGRLRRAGLPMLFLCKKN